jgi:type II restriction enzyme
MNTQTELLNIGNSFGYRTWISKRNASLKSEKLFSAFEDAIEEATYIDCIWFNGDKEMPAIFKSCNEKQIIEAIYRLKNIKELLPPYFTNFVLIAPDNCSEKISSELSKPVFKNFSLKFLPLSQIKNVMTILN